MRPVVSSVCSPPCPSPTTTPPGDEIPGRAGGDRCPGALRLHAADDGALARIRVPGGVLTARQVEVIGRAAEELGDGAVDITSRGNLQVRGLAPDRGADLAARLRAAGLLPSDRHDRIRNVVASPLCGLDGRGHADVQAWAAELDAALCADDPAAGPELAELSGRFLFALDDGRGDVAALGADVTLLARPGGRALLVLGGPGPAGAPRAGAVVSVRAQDARARRCWPPRSSWPRSARAARARGGCANCPRNTPSAPGGWRGR
ncbi:hypothetical protein NKH77_03130 [Streptomyces sp. M19]